MAIGILATIMLAAGTLLAGFRCWSSESSWRLRLAFIGSIVVGAAAGGWGAFCVEYQPKPTLRITGVPFPSLVEQLEYGNWVPFEGPGGLFDLILVPCVVSMPLSVTLVVRRYRRKRLEARPGFEVICHGARAGRVPQEPSSRLDGQEE